jgi:hypothetical protein
LAVFSLLLRLEALLAPIRGPLGEKGCESIGCFLLDDDPRKNALLNAGSKNFFNVVLSEIAPYRIDELCGVGQDVILH